LTPWLDCRLALPQTAEKNMIDLAADAPLLSAPMNNVLILVVGLRMGKAV
jgi:hypothetical protein